VLKQMNLEPRRTALVGSAVLCLLAYWRLLLWDPGGRLLPPPQALFFGPLDNFPQLVFLLTAALVYRRREQFRAALGEPGAPALAVPVLAAGFALFLWGHYVSAVDLLVPSFMLISIGGALLWFGVRFASAMKLPLLVLAFAFPIPAVLTNQAFYALRLQTAADSAVLLPLMGMQVFQQANLISASGITAQIIDSCSGFRFMTALTLASIVYVGWFPARTVRSLILVALAPPIAYAFNLIRVSLIIMDPDSDLSDAHTIQGTLIFLGAITCLVLVDNLLSRLLPGRRNSEAEQPAAVESAGEPPGSPPQSEVEPAEAHRPAEVSRWAVGLAALLVVMLGVSFGMPKWKKPRLGRIPSAQLPGVEDWKLGKTLKLDTEFMWTVRYPKHALRKYRRRNEEVSAFIGYDHRRDRSKNVLSPKNGFPGRGWELVEHSQVELASVAPRVERVLSRDGQGRVLSYYWYEGTERLPGETLRALLALDRSPFRRSQPARVTRVTTDAGPTLATLTAADARLVEFAPALAEALREQARVSKTP
jgi:EpsI family protein